MKFIIDAMLGKLARWLRMMGHDAKYSSNLADKELLNIANKENRILLTRDFQLFQKAINQGLKATFIEGKTEPERIAEVAQKNNIILEVDPDKSNCSVCNTKLRETSKSEIDEKVEKNTLKYYDKFWLCPNCGKVYWQGAHWKNIETTLKMAKEKNKEL